MNSPAAEPPGTSLGGGAAVAGAATRSVSASRPPARTPDGERPGIDRRVQPGPDGGVSVGRRTGGGAARQPLLGHIAELLRLRERLQLLERLVLDLADAL